MHGNEATLLTVVYPYTFYTNYCTLIHHRTSLWWVRFGQVRLGQTLASCRQALNSRGRSVTDVTQILTYSGSQSNVITLGKFLVRRVYSVWFPQDKVLEFIDSKLCDCVYLWWIHLTFCVCVVHICRYLMYRTSLPRSPPPLALSLIPPIGFQYKA